jgi:hypothetical protein
MPYKDPEEAKRKSAERYQKNIEVRKAKLRENYQKNRDKRLAQVKAYVEANKEKVQAYGKAWREANKDLVLAYKREYYQENKEGMIEKSVQYRRDNKDITKKIQDRYNKTDNGKRLRQTQRNARRKREKEASLGRAFHKDILKVYHSCKIMCEVTGSRYEVDHIVPLMGKEVCGLHVPWNLQITPHDINRKKTNKWV